MYELDIWGEDGTFAPPTTISGDNFSDFLKLCFYHADLFSFNEAIWTNCVCNDLQKELEPFLVKEFQTQRWFGYDYSMAPPRDRRQIRVYLYRTDPVAQEIILRHCSDIFLRKNINGVFQDSLQTLEDLCFFSEGELFVGTVSHEFILGVAPFYKDLEDFMKKLGRWKYTDQLPLI